MSSIDFDALQNEALLAIQNSSNADELEQIRLKYFGKKGIITELLKQIATVSPDARPSFGKKVNETRLKVEEALNNKSKTSERSASNVYIDATLEGSWAEAGGLHPISKIIREICSIFSQLGFEIVDGREVETDFYNFTALNIPLNHPSRDAFDTFYTPKGALLRSQTSTVQVREMERRKPPLRILAPGRVYRPDAVDASHSFMFHQVEGLMVDDRTTFSDLKGILHLFLRRLFNKEIEMRFRPHFFPFTEPSVEIDIKWGKKWLEILGAGQVNPNVFKCAGYDSNKVQGFAFGLGVERIAMLRYGIQDIRLLFENNLRFLEQFK